MITNCDYFSSRVPRACLFISNVISGSTNSATLRLFMPFLSSCFSIIRALLAYESATSLCSKKTKKYIY